MNASVPTQLLAINNAPCPFPTLGSKAGSRFTASPVTIHNPSCHKPPTDAPSMDSAFVLALWRFRGCQELMDHLGQHFVCGHLWFRPRRDAGGADHSVGPPASRLHGAMAERSPEKYPNTRSDGCSGAALGPSRTRHGLAEALQHAPTTLGTPRNARQALARERNPRLYLEVQSSSLTSTELSISS